jgi:hypothetical protein
MLEVETQGRRLWAKRKRKLLLVVTRWRPRWIWIEGGH